MRKAAAARSGGAVVKMASIFLTGPLTVLSIAL